MQKFLRLARCLTPTRKGPQTQTPKTTLHPPSPNDEPRPRPGMWTSLRSALGDTSKNTLTPEMPKMEECLLPSSVVAQDNGRLHKSNQCDTHNCPVKHTFISNISILQKRKQA